MKLFTAGYGRWPTTQRMNGLIQALKDAGVTLLIDTRHSPCASQVKSTSHYTARDWNLQPGAAGIAAILQRHASECRWLVELGNPQKNDPAMAVLREHLVSGDEKWPVNRGLALLAKILGEDGPCALLCACADWKTCHRTVVADALRERFPEMGVEVVHV